MADIDLVIKIPQKWLDDMVREEFTEVDELCALIQHSTPLPKGHGRILDEKDILNTENNGGGWYDLVDMSEYIAGVKAIIEADKELNNEDRRCN